MKHSPLDADHRARGAKMAEFGGWEMPMAFPAGTIAEHQACRSGSAVFDVSHLGTLRVEGPDAFAALQSAFTNDLRRIGPGRAQYTHLLDPVDASVLDDIIVWWLPSESGEPNVFDVMPNASNTDRVVEALRLGAADIRVTDSTAHRAVLAVQGPHARSRTATVFPELAAVSHFAVQRVDLRGVPCLAAGTGYTGEDGFELAVPAEAAPRILAALIGAGSEPAGLGARDTLRLEAGLPLHGHELGPGITPWQAKLGWVVRLDKGEFQGRAPLVAEREQGVSRSLVGLRLDGRQPAREGSIVKNGSGLSIGVVSSGNFGPSLGYAIAFAFVDAKSVEMGDSVTCDVRGKALSATVVKPPFLSKD